uniref:Uncharacterized protein n=1 Tax=Panagrolaimus sp. ES5 TaxID=591445 RepID=A0AC34GLB9_9BILA
TSNTTQLKVKQRRNRCRHRTSPKETESSSVHGKSNVNGMIKCFEPVRRGLKRTYFNSNNVLARGSTINNEYVFQNALGLKKRYLSNSPADIDSNWRNRDSVRHGYRTRERNEYSNTLGNSKANKKNDFRDRKRNVDVEKPERPSSNRQRRDQRTIARTLFLSRRG